MPKTSSALSMTGLLWLLNGAIGARVAVKEGLPAEWVADLYVGHGAVARAANDGRTGAVYGAEHTRRYGWEDRGFGTDPAGCGGHLRGSG